MGLDNYLQTSEEVGENVYEELANVNLCGGMFSGNGSDGSFRGKVYNDYVEEVTGVSLYENSIGPETLLGMAEAIRQDLNLAGIEDCDLHDLATLFEVGGKYGCSLLSWY